MFPLPPFDVFARILFGGRVSLAIGVAVMLVSVVVGTLVGAVSGFFGGRVDTLIMRLIDVIISFPSLFLLVMLAMVFGSSLLTIVLVIGLLGWMRVARLVCAAFLSVRERDFVLAARAQGCRPGHLILRHLLPNSLGPIIVAATIDISGGHPHRVGVVLPGVGCTAAASQLGQYAALCPGSDESGAVDRLFPRPDDLSGEHCHQFHRRWSARCL